jgi:hypothetical protein
MESPADDRPKKENHEATKLTKVFLFAFVFFVSSWLQMFV